MALAVEKRQDVPADGRRRTIVSTVMGIGFAAYVWMLFMGVHYHILELRVGQAPRQSVVRLISLRSPFTIRVPGKVDAKRRLGFVYQNRDQRIATTERRLPIEPSFQAGWGMIYSRQVVETTSEDALADFICSHHTFKLRGRELTTTPSSGPMKWNLKGGETVEINVRTLPAELPDPDNKNFKEVKEPWDAATKPAAPVAPTPH